MCLPPKELFSSKFINQKVQMSGYGKTGNGENADTSCKVQVAKSTIVAAKHSSCRKVKINL